MGLRRRHGPTTIALWGADVAALTRQKEIYEELGFTDASEVKDRFYFNSMYCRAPGGILVESCCNQGRRLPAR